MPESAAKVEPNASEPPIGPDDPRVQLFAELETMAENMLAAADMFGEIAVAFAKQVALAKAIKEAADGATKN